MNIAGIDYDLNNKALSIFVSGCDGKCLQCHNESLWNFNVGEDWTTYGKKFRQYLSTNMIKYIWIMGGEPLLNNINSLELMLKYLYQFKKKIMLWTRFQEKDIPENIKQYLSYAKVGEYRCNSESYEEPLFGITLASKNQEIIKLK